MSGQSRKFERNENKKIKSEKAGAKQELRRDDLTGGIISLLPNRIQSVVGR